MESVSQRLSRCPRRGFSRGSCLAGRSLTGGTCTSETDVVVLVVVPLQQTPTRSTVCSVVLYVLPVTAPACAFLISQTDGFSVKHMCTLHKVKQ
jgi:hypothetical protein